MSELVVSHGESAIFDISAVAFSSAKNVTIREVSGFHDVDGTARKSISESEISREQFYWTVLSAIGSGMIDSISTIVDPGEGGEGTLIAACIKADDPESLDTTYSITYSE